MMRCCAPLHCNPPQLRHNRNIKVIFLRSGAQGAAVFAEDVAGHRLA